MERLIEPKWLTIRPGYPWAYHMRTMKAEPRNEVFQ
jgi:hypothetical protein